MKKGTKFALFAAAAAGIAVVGAKLAEMVRLQNEELNDMINQTPAPQPEEDPSDYVMPGDSAEAPEEAGDDGCAEEEDSAVEEYEEPAEEPVEEDFAEDGEPDEEEPLA